MESKYTIINKNEDVKYIETCPLLLVAHAITKDNPLDQVLVQLKMKSLSRKKIKAAYIALKCYDVEGVELKSVDRFEFLDLNVDFNEIFGQSTPIYLPDKSTRKVEISVSKIIFSNENYWKNDTNGYFRNLPVLDYIRNSLTPELLEQYVREINIEKNKYLPIEGPDYWICSCGSFNPLSEDKCHECKNSKMNIFKFSNESYLSETLTQYNEMKSIAEEKKRHIYEKKAKRNKRFRNVGVIAVLIIIGFFIINNLLIPELKYSKAVSLLEQEEYAEAFELFNELDTYKDSVERKEETDIFLKGIAAYNKGDYFEAYNLFLENPEYKGAADYMENSEEGIYKQALDFVESGELDTALLYFETISNYKDSNTKIIEVSDLINFEKAEKLFNKKEYIDALESINAMSVETAEVIQLKDQILLGQAEAYFSDRDYENALETIKSTSNISNEAIKFTDKVYLRKADVYYHEGNIDEALAQLDLIEEKSEAVYRLENDILDFKNTYGKWLGEWWLEDEDAYSLLIKPQWNDNQLKLQFENSLNDVYIDYIYNDDGTITYNYNYNHYDYYTLTYVDDSTIARTTYTKYSDGSSEKISEEYLYKND